ncbi:MAG: ATP-binding protein [Solirubrobacteraceae bacterium]|jgi:anti-sigma regulatory factor (Ser/Thr protein kinase)
MSIERSVTSRETSELCLPAQPSKLGVAREYAQRAAAAFGLDADRCYEFVFAVNEAVTNAIRHGRPDEHGQIHLSVLVDGDRLTFAVRDYGTFAASTFDRMTSSERGRGFALMTRLMDAVQLCAAPGSTTVRLSTLACERAPGEGAR